MGWPEHWVTSEMQKDANIAGSRGYALNSFKFLTNSHPNSRLVTVAPQLFPNPLNPFTQRSHGRFGD